MPDTADNHQLIAVARRSIEHGLQYDSPWLPAVQDYPRAWHDRRASFVTLKRHGDLRGCVGTTEAIDPLVISVARNAYAAAFRDPRFPALPRHEFAAIELSLSLLTPAEPLDFTSEAELLALLEPGHDGLIIEYRDQHATFLPSVWETLPGADAFLAALKHKAGLQRETVPERAWRYQCEIISE